MRKMYEGLCIKENTSDIHNVHSSVLQGSVFSLPFFSVIYR